MSLTKLSLTGKNLIIPGQGDIHCKKKVIVFPSLAGMPLTKLSLTGKNLIIPGQGEFG
jgi:hypothetical protein